MIAEKIQQLRKQRGLTQQELADLIGVHVASIRGWEQGRYEPKGIRFNRLCDVLGISIDELTGHDFSKTRVPILGRIPAGIPMEAIEDILDYEDIPSSWSGDYFGLRVRGDSMEPKYINGDTVIVRRQSDCDTGDDCIVLVNGFDATLKTVIKHDDGIELKPYNQKYNSMFFDSGVEIIGVVIELRRRLKNITL